MTESNFSRAQLFAMDACTGCRACAEVCPAVMGGRDGQLSGLYRLTWLRRALRGRGGLLRFLLGAKPSADDWRDFAETVFRCTLCGNCQEVCPVGIRLRDLWLSLRQELSSTESGPQTLSVIASNLADEYNVFGEDNEERSEWVEDLDDEPEDGLIKDRAEVVYFTGCVAAFYPLAQQVPLALADILRTAGVDFTLLGEEEWCCGFPLMGAGMWDKAQEMIDHNLAAVRAKGAKEVVFACPSCYLTWKEHYGDEFKLTHASQYLDRLIKDRAFEVEPKEMVVTFHDPCDLGRGAREFEAPRRVIAALPGVKLVEMADNRENCLCCGGGGNLEMIDKDLAQEIARLKIDQALATGAEAVVTSCQQCVRAMSTYVRRNKIDLKIMDLTQLVAAALRRED